MTLAELIEKNRKIRLAREKEMQVKQKIEEKAEEPIKERVEEAEKKEEAVSIPHEESKKESTNKPTKKTSGAVKKSTSEKKVKAPANRAYMVVEDIEKVND